MLTQSLYNYNNKRSYVYVWVKAFIRISYTNIYSVCNVWVGSAPFIMRMHYADACCNCNIPPTQKKVWKTTTKKKKITTKIIQTKIYGKYKKTMFFLKKIFWFLYHSKSSSFAWSCSTCSFPVTVSSSLNCSVLRIPSLPWSSLSSFDFGLTDSFIFIPVGDLLWFSLRSLPTAPDLRWTVNAWR